MKHYLTQSALLLLVFLPQSVSAAPGSFAEVVDWVAEFASLLVPVIIALTFLYILWGLARYWIISGGNEENVGAGRWVIITGVIGLTVMVGIWGLVSLVRNAIFF